MQGLFTLPTIRCQSRYLTSNLFFFVFFLSEFQACNVFYKFFLPLEMCWIWVWFSNESLHDNVIDTFSALSHDGKLKNIKIKQICIHMEDRREREMLADGDTVGPLAFGPCGSLTCLERGQLLSWLPLWLSSFCSFPVYPYTRLYLSSWTPAKMLV